MNHASIAGAFQKAGLCLQLASRPFVTAFGAEEVVQLDIRKETRRGRETEEFVLWPGGSGTYLAVEAADPGARQLVLAVREPARSFQLPVWQARAGRRGPARFETRRVPAERRSILLGLDERSYFMCEVPEQVSSVREAHAALEAPGLALARVDGARIVRQGEWFFIEPATPEREVVDRHARSSLAVLRRRAGIPGRARGRPHVAEELLSVPASLFAPAAAIGPSAAPVVFPLPAAVRTYVRGTVRHPDHATVEFKAWVRVALNRERIRQGVGVPVGRFAPSWID